MHKDVNTDYLLWKRLKAGETKAFSELYQQFADVLYSFGMIYSKDHEMVNDCIHDLFFELYKYRKNLADNDNIKNYLFKSLKRKIQSNKNRKINLIYSSDYTEVNDLKSSVESEDAEAQEENIGKIRKAIDKLPERQQEALNLRFLIGLPYPEVAKIMEISLESARTLIYRSVKTLRNDLKENKNQLVLFYIQTKFEKRLISNNQHFID